MEKDHDLVTTQRSLTPITQEPQCVNKLPKGSNYKKDDNIQRIDFDEIVRKVKLKLRTELFGRVGRQMKARPPKPKELLDAHQFLNIEKAFEEVVLNYHYLSFDGLYENDLMDMELVERLDTSINDENFLELEELFKTGRNFMMYEHAVQLLSKNPKQAKAILIDLAHDAVQPACYALAVTIFKETMDKCDVLNNSENNVEVIENNKEDIIDAVQLLIFSKLMEPACSFLLGMLKRNNIGNINRFIDGIYEWEDYLFIVMEIVTNCGIFNIPQYVFETKRNTNLRYRNTLNCELGLGMKRKKEYLTEMGKYAIYEIALDMRHLNEQWHLNESIDLFNILLKEEFPQALFAYSAMLLQEIGENRTPEQIVKEVVGHLNRAISLRYHDAKFLLGILPFYDKCGSILNSHQIRRSIQCLEIYIVCSSDDCNLNKQNIDKAAYCLAAQFYSKSYFLKQDQQKAEKLLSSRNMHGKLLELQFHSSRLKIE